MGSSALAARPDLRARGDAVHGWAAGAPNISVYVNQNAQEKGVGAALILGLIGASEAERYRTL